MSVRFSARALRQLREIHAYIAKDSPRAASEVIAHIEELCYGLTDFPDMGYRTDHGDTRVLVVTRYPYKIFYRVLKRKADTEVRILLVRHSAMDAQP
jgi:plasmid stabilization system protein ParE